jgi:hypothetical protein
MGVDCIMDHIIWEKAAVMHRFFFHFIVKLAALQCDRKMIIMLSNFVCISLSNRPSDVTSLTLMKY